MASFFYECYANDVAWDEAWVMTVMGASALSTDVDLIPTERARARSLSSRG